MIARMMIPVLFALVGLASTAHPNDRVNIIVAPSSFTQSNIVPRSFVQQLSDDHGIDVNVVNPSTNSLPGLFQAIDKASQRDGGVSVLVGLSAWTLGQFVDNQPARFRPEWQLNAPRPVADLSSHDGVVMLGAGFRHAQENGKSTIISVPRGRTPGLPILTAAVVATEDSHNSPRSNQEIARIVLESILSTPAGLELQRALTLIPAQVPPTSGASASSTAFGMTRVLLRAETDDDGDTCDCDDSGGSIAQSCDPDGYVVAATSALPRDDTRVFVPGFTSNSGNDDDDGCDDCDDSSVWRVSQFQRSEEFRSIRQRMSSNFDGADWSQHFNDLSLQERSGSTVIVLTCDPD